MWKRLHFRYLVLAIALLEFGWAGSFYLYEDFTGLNATNGWVTNIGYGRGVGTICPTQTTQGGVMTTWTNTSGVYQLRNTPNEGFGGRNGLWIGRYCYNSNLYFATSKQPFGVEIRRTFTWLDQETNDNASAGDLRRNCAISFWLFEENTTAIPKINSRYTNDTSLYSTFKNSIEFCNQVGVWGTGDLRYIIGYNESSLTTLNTALSNAVRPDGRISNIHAAINFDYRLDMAYGISNNDDTGWRLVHNGNYIQMYVNPNPAGTNVTNWANEWMFIGERQVVWNSNIQFMFGHSQMANNATSGTATSKSFREDVDWDDCRIQSAVDSAIGYLRPAMEDDAEKIEVHFSFEPRNAGINFFQVQIGERDSDLRADQFSMNLMKMGKTQRVKAVKYIPDHFPEPGEIAVMNLGRGKYRLLLAEQIMPNSDIPQVDLTIRGRKGTEPIGLHVMAERFAFMPNWASGKDATTGWHEVAVYRTPEAMARLKNEVTK